MARAPIRELKLPLGAARLVLKDDLLQSGERMTTPQDRSPKITSVSWGRVEVEGGLRFKDAKLFPGGAREWDWRETGTEHAPGIAPADVEELLRRGATVVVLSTGVYGRLQVMPDTLARLSDAGVGTHVLRTKNAVRLYNDLRETEAVGGLIHSTC